MATEKELVDRLENGVREVADFFRSLDPKAASSPISASEHPGGRPWTPKDHLAHLVARERDFLEVAHRVVAREPNPLRLERRGSTVEERAAYVNRENQLNVDDRRELLLPDLLEDLLALRSQLASLVGPLSQDDLTRPVAVAPGRELPACTLLESSDRHAKAHLGLLREGAREPN
jgi:hypothetical protein